MAINPPTSTTHATTGADGVNVWVPQHDGEVQISRDGGTTRVFAVAEHIVEVARDEVAHFLRHVPGAVVHDPNASAPPEGEPPEDQTPEAAAAVAAAREQSSAEQPSGSPSRRPAGSVGPSTTTTNTNTTITSTPTEGGQDETPTPGA